METALVSALYTDAHNIPHIRFHVVFEKPFRAPVKDGPRVLAMKQFFKQFPERVTSAHGRQAAGPGRTILEPPATPLGRTAP